MNKKWRWFSILVLALIMLPATGTWAVTEPEKEGITPASVFIPLWYITPGVLELPAGFDGSLIYDEEQKVYFLRAPAAVDEGLLTALRENMTEAATLFVLYTLRIVELRSVSAWDWVFSGELSSAEPAESLRFAATPRVFQGEKGLRFMVENGLLETTPGFHSYKGMTEAWLLAVPGSPVKWRTGAIYPGEYDKDENYLLQITPVSIQKETGRVESEVSFTRENEAHGELAALTTTVYSDGGKPEIVAFMRRTVDREQGRILTAGLKEERDFLLVLTAVPLKLENQGEIWVLPMASLEGLAFFAPRLEQTPEREWIMETGLMSTGCASADKREINPALYLLAPVDELTDLELFVQAPATYFLRVKSGLGAGSGLSLAATLSSGLGLGSTATPALMVGVCDDVQVLRDVHASVSWYPLVFLLDSRVKTGKNRWQAGITWDLDRIELALALAGDPRLSAKWFGAAWYIRRDLWLRLGVISENEDSYGIFLGIGLSQD